MGRAQVMQKVGQRTYNGAGMASGAQRIFNGLVYSLLLLLPLMILPAEWILNFELPKMVFFRVVVLLMTFVFVVRMLGGSLAVPKVSLAVPKVSLAVPVIFKKPIVKVLLLLFLLVLALSTVFSIAPKLSFWGGYYRMQGAYSWLHYFLFFILLTLGFRERSQWESAKKFLFGGFVLVLIVAVLQSLDLTFYKHPIWASSFQRIFSTFAHPSDFAVYIIMLIFPFISCRQRRFWQVIIILLAILGLALAKSRAAILGFVIGLSFYSLLYTIFFRHKKVLLVAIFLPLISFLGVVLINVYSDSTLVQNNYLLKRAVLKDEELRSVEVRLAIWQDSLNMLNEKPFFGYGLETFPLALSKYASPQIAELEKNNALPDKAHNSLLEVASNTGFAGLIIFTAVILTIFRLGIDKLKENSMKLGYIKIRLEIIGILSAFTALLTANLFGFSTTVHFVITAFLLAYLLFLISEKNTDKSAEASITRTFKIKRWQKISVTIFVGIFVFFSIVLQNIFYLTADFYAVRGFNALREDEANEVVKNFTYANMLRPDQSYYNYILASVYIQLKEPELVLKYAEKGAAFDAYNDTFYAQLLEQIKVIKE